MGKDIWKQTFKIENLTLFKAEFENNDSYDNKR